MTGLNTDMLKQRVRHPAEFVRFEYPDLWYVCEDGFDFAVPVEDTRNTQGATPVFKAVDRGIYFMRWIRAAMLSTEDK